MNKHDFDESYYSSRYKASDSRAMVWREIIKVTCRYWPQSPDILELGPGYGDFINQVSANQKTAIDISSHSKNYVASEVRFIHGDCADLSMIAAHSMDLVFASNLLEHLERSRIIQCLQAVMRVLKPGGKLVLIQPNFRYCYDRFFDDYTHITPMTDKGLCGLLLSEGYHLEESIPRFMPLSMQTSKWIPRYRWLVRLYLRLPYRPLAGQMLLVAAKPLASRED